MLTCLLELASCEVMSQQAKVMNERIKSNLPLVVPSLEGELVAQAPPEDRQRGSRNAFDMAGLADKRYAISETLVEQSRQDYRAQGKGNWIQDRHAHFCSQFGAVLPARLHDEDSDEDITDTACQAVFGPGVCRTVARDARYVKMKTQCNVLLRQTRSVRREKGYLPYHAVLLVLGPDSEQILSVYLLCRVSFSPFDFTVIELQILHGPTLPLQAVTAIAHGVAKMMSMAQLLRSLIDQNPVLGTADYRALSLGSVVIEGTVRKLADLQTASSRPAAPDEESEGDDDDDMVDRYGTLLKRASAGKAAPKPKRKTKKRRAPTAPRSSAPRQQAAARESAVCDQVDDDIERAWTGVIEDEAGANPRLIERPCGSSSSSRRGQPSHDQPPAAENPGDDKPWKDEKGYCFLWKRGESGVWKKIHIGHAS